MVYHQKRKPDKSLDLKGFQWLRGEDLNLRPSGYERDDTFRRYDIIRLFAAWSGLKRTPNGTLVAPGCADGMWRWRDGAPQRDRERVRPETGAAHRPPAHPADRRGRRTALEAPMRTVAGPPQYVVTAMKRVVSIGGRIYHVDARTAAMLERIAGRAEKIRRIQIGEITVKFHDRVRSLLITESDDPWK
jgi:hypothetical protein